MLDGVHTMPSEGVTPAKLLFPNKQWICLFSNLIELKFSTNEVWHTEECTEKLHVHFNSVLVHLEKYYYTTYIDSSLVPRTNFFHAR